MNIKEELEKLTKNIYIPMVFYIPCALFPDMSEESKKNLEDQQFFNTIQLLNINEDVKPLQNNILSVNVLKKSSILKSNFLELLEFENKLTKESFKHLINEYLNSAYGYDYVYTWMATHIDNDVPTALDNEKHFFMFQAQALNQHIRDIHDRFLKNKKYNNTKINFKKIINYGTDVLVLDKKLKTVLKNRNTTSLIQTKKKNKFMPPSEEDVKKMLLKSVFNVNYSELT